jgi:hypothetical protein
MKKLLFIASVLLGTLAVQAQNKKADDLIKVNVEKLDFGKIKQGVPVTSYFEITNKSNETIIIENAWAGCGCTTPEVPKEPIAPNTTVKMKVGYNAAALNHFEKDVNIKLVGVNEPKVLKISGEVLDATAYEAYMKTNKKPSSNIETSKTTPAKSAAKPAVKKSK